MRISDVVYSQGKSRQKNRQSSQLDVPDFDPLDRLRLVGSLEQLRPDARPVLTSNGLPVEDQVRKEWDPRKDGLPTFWRFEMLKPRNLRSSGRATALFASLTVSRSFVVRNRLTEAITRSPARRLRT